MKHLAFLCCTFFCCMAGYGQHSLYDAGNLRALQQLPVLWQHYWNTHNMDSMGSLLCEDVDFINVAGIWMKGKKATVADHKEKHLGIRFGKSAWQTDSVSVRYLSDTIALLHVGWGISGDFENETTPRPPRHGLFTWVAIKQNNHWMLQAAQNTNIKDNTH